jgi:3',5'-cyclic AMP phosphodiesterase CpdA
VGFIVQVTDPHLRLDPDREGPEEALARAVDTILELQRPPAAVLVTGDVADSGHPDEYAQFKRLLAPITVPVHVIPGNHDDRGALADALGEQPDTVDAAGLRVVLCDTTIPGRPSGRLDTERLDRLLAEAPDQPTLVALHHPPLLTGIPLLDEIGLEPGTRERLEQTLGAHPQVRRVVCGHVHRASFESLGGCGVLTSPSTYLQAEPGPGPGGIRFVERGAAIMLHHLRDDGTVVSHVQPIQADR